MKLAAQISESFRDVLAFGPRIILRHAHRLFGRRTVQLHIPHLSRGIAVRIGESDFAAVRHVFREKEYDFGEGAVHDRIFARYRQIVATGKSPIIIDAGANIGAASLWFRNEFPLARVVAIEPEQQNLAILKRNVGSDDRVIILRTAIGSEPGFASVQGHGWGAKTERQPQGIPVVTMYDAFGSVRDGTPFIAKIDIEGFESDLFASNTDWLGEIYVMFIEIHDWMLPGKLSSRTFQKAIAKHDFEIFLKGQSLAYVRID
jgi:FkbM family methyltransferase